MTQLEPHERKAFVEGASAFLALLERAEVRLETHGPQQPVDESYRKLRQLLQELRQKYPDIQAFHFRGRLFNPVRIAGNNQEGKPFVFDFLQTIHDQGICEVE